MRSPVHVISSGGEARERGEARDVPMPLLLRRIEANQLSDRPARYAVPVEPEDPDAPSRKHLPRSLRERLDVEGQ